MQDEVIPDQRFITPGLGNEGGFIGAHDRMTGMPLPDHISANPKDLGSLMGGMIETYALLLNSEYNPVLTAALIAFGFVFIHPFEDGNGRIHRYLIHHVLAETGFVPKGLVFPVSAVILERIEAYKKILEHFSKRRLGLVEWRPTVKNNVEVLNDTRDLYRFFDATKQAEFLFMPDNKVDLLIRFLVQNGGRLYKRAIGKEFSGLTENERRAIEARYLEIYSG